MSTTNALSADWCLEYRFAKLNKRLEVPIYSDKEYEEYLKSKINRAHSISLLIF